MNSHSKQRNVLISSILLLLVVSSACIFFTSCDLSFKFPSFPSWKRDPTKQDVLDDFALKLKTLSGVEARLNGDNIIFSFKTGTTESILTQQVKNAFSQLSSITEKDTLQIRIASGDVLYSTDAAASSVMTQIKALIATQEVWKEEVEYNAKLIYKGFDFELHGDLVFHDLHRILMTDEEWAQLQADNFKSLYNDVLNLTTVTVHFDHISAIFSALSAINSSLPAVKEKLAFQENHLDELVETVLTSTETTPEQKDTIAQLKKMLGVFVVPLTMVSNDNTTMAIDSIPLKLDGTDVSDQYTFEFRNEKDDVNPITELDLSNGASTFIIYMEATPNEGSPLAPISGDVVIKIGSVSIGNETTLYTIEDAIELAGYKDIFVRYNTSFAPKEVAEKVYGKSTHRIGSPTTLVLPYDGSLSSGVDDTPGNDTAGSITRSREYVRLTVPDGITIDLKGRLVVNAKRASIATKFQGHVTGTNYSVLHLEENSKINVEYRGELYALGFIEGDGEIEVESGGYVYEGLFISSFRGGAATVRIEEDVFPFDQYTVMQIESPLIINEGAHYIAKALILVRPLFGTKQIYHSGDFPLAGSSALIRLSGGQLEKTFDIDSGHVIFTFNGNGTIGNSGVQVGSDFASTKGRAIPFDGTWHFIVSSGSTVTIDAKVALLPGSSLTIENGAEVVIKKGFDRDRGRNELTIFSDIPYTYSYTSYPNGGKDEYYRTIPNIAYTKDSKAKVDNYGTLTIEENSGIAGHVTGSESVDLKNGSITEYDFYIVEGSADSAKAKPITVTYR